MKKILSLLVGGLLIACMAGPAVAAVKDENLIGDPDGQIVLTELNKALTVPFNYEPYGDIILGGTKHKVTVTLTETSDGLEVTLPEEFYPSKLTANGDSASKEVYFYSDDDPWAWWYKYSNPNTENAYVKSTKAGAEGSLKIEVEGFVYSKCRCWCTHDAITIAEDTDPISTQIPEFPTVALPVAAVLGLVFIFGRKKEGL
ncbi:hypothetical protein MSSAC_3164 [Methanosarcina siciliae C2J]|uniref:PEF-CTERM protein sorting domain-containing protein n=1 Tax=Methanosarcina siciliae C2J TaxID=1434118 RepID=A0A0E3PRL4_9EURY|nr:PEF-CTERM sorting domain-containing protein [Methanosarcina siciliae]AKB37754.1 hypothetical protein MSSAC_3164 [Methanosarcina siciliae C2J]